MIDFHYDGTICEARGDDKECWFFWGDPERLVVLNGEFELSELKQIVCEMEKHLSVEGER